MGNHLNENTATESLTNRSETKETAEPRHSNKDAKAAADMIKSQWSICLKERRRKYEQHLEKTHLYECKTKSENTEGKWAVDVPKSKSKPRKPPIVFEDNNTSYTQTIIEERIKARKIQKKRLNRSNAHQDLVPEINSF